MPTDYPTLTVADAAEWRSWLAREGATSPGVLLSIAKKPSCTLTSLTYAEALDDALCHGWIDSTGRKVDDATHVHRFTPRKAKSIWSKRNVGYIERLESEGRMQPAGRAVVEAAKADGRWDAAYSGSGNAEPPAEFLAALAQVPAAEATWAGLNKGNRWAIYFNLLNLRTQAGREKRIKFYVDMLARGETPKPQKQKRKLHSGAEKQSCDEDAAAADNEATHVEPPSSTRRKTRSGRPAPSYVQ